MYERTILDFRNIHKQYYNKMFYILCETNPDYYKTVYCRYNIWTDTVQPCLTDWIYGTPPEGMEEINPRLLSTLQRHNAYKAMNTMPKYC